MCKLLLIVCSIIVELHLGGNTPKWEWGVVLSVGKLLVLRIFPFLEQTFNSSIKFFEMKVQFVVFSVLFERMLESAKC